jgi:type II secretory pathway pseudopilin PulG
MTASRGDVVIALFPHAGGSAGKPRPVLVVQSDAYNAKIKNLAARPSDELNVPPPERRVQRRGSPMSRRLGLSRVEVLVALLIILLVAGTTLVAIVRLRDAANRARCQCNLKQLALAMQQYQESFGGLPPLTDQGNRAPTGRGLPSVFTNLIPYIEATPLVFRPERSPDYYHAHSSVTFTYSHKGMPFTQVGGMANCVMPVFIDPADATAERLRDMPMTLPDGTTGYYATGSYAANGLVPWGTGGLPRMLPPGRLANTILFAERPQLCRTTAGEDIYNLWGLGFYSPHMPAFAALTPAEPPDLWPTSQIAPVEPLPEEGEADQDTQILVRVGRRDAAPQPPDFPTPVQILRGGRPCDPRLPGSPHSAGMQAAMGNASVRVFAPDTSPWAFWAACIPPTGNENAAGGR